MIPALFYPTQWTDTFTYDDNKTFSIELTQPAFSQADYGAKFFDGYYVGWVKSDNVPKLFLPSKITIDGTHFKSERIDVGNCDFGYGYNNAAQQPNFQTKSILGNNSPDALELFNSLSPLQTTMRVDFGVFVAVKYWQDPSAPLLSTETDVITFSTATTSSKDFIDFMDGSLSLTLTYYNPAMGTTTTQSFTIADMDDTGKVEFTGTVGAYTYDLCFFIISLQPYRQLQHYYSPNGYSGNTNFLYDKTAPFLHFMIDGEDAVAMPSITNAIGYAIGTIECDFNYTNIYISNPQNLTYGEYNWSLHANVDIDLSTLQPTNITRNGDSYVIFKQQTLYGYSYNIITPLLPQDIRFYVAMFPSLNSGYQGDQYLPKFSDAKELTGDFFAIADLATEGTEWQQSGQISDSTYTEDDKPQPEPTDDEITTDKHNAEDSLPLLTGLRLFYGDAFSTFYDVSVYHIRELGNLIAQMPQTFWDALGTATDSKQSNLLDYIVALKWYPILIHDSSDTATSAVQFGFSSDAKVTFTAAGNTYKMGNICRLFDMGTVSVPYRVADQSFLDLEPYTSVTAYLPYVGTTTLQANDIIGDTINCNYIVDFSTGMCTAILDNGTDTIYIGTGKIGVDISVSGNDILTQSERMASSYIGAASKLVNNGLSVAASAAVESPTGIASTSVSTVADIATSAMSIANSKRGIPQTVGAASGIGGSYTHQRPYIRVQRPAVSIPAAYGHDVGYVCNRTYYIGTLSGYTQCQNPDLSGIPATATELEMLRQILCTGFYA